MHIPFQSFLVVSTLLVTALELPSLLALHRFGSSFNVIPSGPVGLAFSLVYQYFSLVPATYHFRVFGVTLSNKAFVYALALQVNKQPNFKRSHPYVCFRRVSSPSVSHGPPRSPRCLGFPPAPYIGPTLPVSKATGFLLGLYG